MAHSFLTYKNRNERLNDTYIEISIYVIENVVEETAISAELKNQISIWSEAVRSAAPGCIDLELDSMTDELRSETISLLDKAIDHLSSFGDKIPKEYLNKKTGVSLNLFLENIKTDVIQKSITQFKNILL